MDDDAFGRIYEYFLGEFARTEGSKGGEFYTPSGVFYAMRAGAGHDPASQCVRICDVPMLISIGPNGGVPLVRVSTPNLGESPASLSKSPRCRSYSELDK